MVKMREGGGDKQAEEKWVKENLSMLSGREKGEGGRERMDCKRIRGSKKLYSNLKSFVLPINSTVFSEKRPTSVQWGLICSLLYPGSNQEN